MLRTLARWLGLTDDRAERLPHVTREWREMLRRHIWQYQYLSSRHRLRVDEVVCRMVGEHRWTGGSGYEVTDEMRVVISGIVGLMSLGLDEPYTFPRVPEIILYPKGFFATSEQMSAWSSHPVLGSNLNQPRLGEAWQWGPIVLAWDRIVDPFDNSGWHVNVVIHEFTHHLDGLDGDMEGMPPLESSELEHEWHRVTELDYLQLVGEARRGEQGLLSHYGATNRAEFFAVASEVFFDHPHDLRDEHPHLYEVLAKFFRQSPADFLPRDAQPPIHRRGRTAWRRPRRYRPAPQLEIDPFVRGLSQYQEQDYRGAVASFSEVISSDPEDGEAYTSRGLAYLGLQQWNEALSDANQALEFDDSDYDAQLVRGCALVRCGELKPGIQCLRYAVEHTNSSLANAHLGWAYLKQNEPRKALHHLSLAHAIEPYDAQTLRWRAEAHLQMGDEKQAEDDRQRADRLDPTD
ncbi:zinc-dependent peptidase [Aeoliella mucimassa]|uniref:Protein MtfA n=1 Tax=Aeoliella mucimassa TaxID=2527972 RepID=A0A518ANK9_9BACT|nr:zinc-dependent peptidase [Aeoliella mucimassa]QDU56315.1 Protein MtfA [Aeoliella mucimassa]